MRNASPFVVAKRAEICYTINNETKEELQSDGSGNLDASLAMNGQGLSLMVTDFETIHDVTIVAFLTLEL